jgi:FtsH-binding integral membrane protein
MNGGTLVREGIITGLLGAAGVAVWFLVIDTLAGHPLFTPDALGRMLFAPLGVHVMAGVVHPGIVAGYTLFHVAVFVAVGILAALLVRVAERQPVVLALFVVLFAIVEMGFYGLTAVLDTTGVLGSLAWWQVAGGNLVGTLLMGGYLWRRHPGLAHEIDVALSR